MSFGRKNKSGFTLIEIVISMGLVSILALVIFGLNNLMNTGKSTSSVVFQADQFRKDILQTLNNPAAWRQTLLKNATFACIYNQTDCATGANQGPPDYTYLSVSNSMGACAAGVCKGGFDVYDAQGNAHYSPASSASAGYNRTGNQCTTFSGVYNSGSKKFLGGTSSCPFRLVLYWQPLCPTTGTCNNPPIRVRGYTIYAPSAADTAVTAFNPGQYGVDVILPPNYK